MALLLLHQNATVTICHSKTPNLADESPHRPTSSSPPSAAPLSSPPISSAPAQPSSTSASTASPTAPRPNESSPEPPAKLRDFDQKGSILLGDVHPIEGPEIAGAYTPVPGGVGPLTIAMLMSNTVRAAELHATSPQPARCST